MLASGRFAAAVRSARWGHVALELALLVSGILIALAINGWIDDRRDAGIERQYLELLTRDLEQDLETLDSVRQFEEAQTAASALVYRGLRRGVTLEDREAVAAALSQLTSRRTLRLRRGTYTNLLSTGHLRLIRNAQLRDRIVRLYENNERVQMIRDRNNQEFVDRLYMTYLFDQGFVAPRPSLTLPGLGGSDGTFARRVGIAATTADDPIWRLSLDAPSLRVLAVRVWYRGIVSEAALDQTRQSVAEISEVRGAIDRELAQRRWP
jgi:hypothetical protein